jgi:polyhydroxybutyrate depolymerase
MAERWRELDACPDPPTEDTLPSTGDDTDVHRFTTSACAGGSGVVFMQVDGGGHTWPGGTQCLPKVIIGPTTRTFDASEASWQFFASHPR